MGIHSFVNPQTVKTSPCVTRTLLLLSVTMAPACARLALPEMTLPGPSSPPLWVVQDMYPYPEIPCGARNHHQLGRHGEDLAPHLLQRAPCCSRGAARPAD